MSDSSRLIHPISSNPIPISGDGPIRPFAIFPGYIIYCRPIPNENLKFVSDCESNRPNCVSSCYFVSHVTIPVSWGFLRGSIFWNLAPSYSAQRACHPADLLYCNNIFLSLINHISQLYVHTSSECERVIHSAA